MHYERETENCTPGKLERDEAEREREKSSREIKSEGTEGEN